jgi:hypothetical protein
MATITLAQLRTEARERADMQNNNFVKDSELNNYINNSISELHDLLIQAYESDYYINEVEFTTTSQQDSYDLSTVISDDNFYKLRGVDAKLNNSEWFTLQPFTFNERNRRQNFGAWRYLGISNVRYRLVGNTIRFTPVPDDNIPVRLWYIPTAQVLTNDTDTLRDLNNFSEYIIVDAAIKMLAKEESDTTQLERTKAQLKRRIEEAANNRDAGMGDSVSDVYNENNEFFFGRTLT